MNISIPRDYYLLKFETSASRKGLKHRLLFGPPGLHNVMQRTAWDYVSREETLHKKDVLEIGAERKRKDIEQYESLEIEIDPDSLLNMVRDLRSAGLIKCSEIYL